MVKSLRSVFVAAFLAFALALAQVSPAYAAALPAEINQQFTPLQIDAGGVSRLRISIYNPNTFSLSNASFTNTFPAGLYVATPANVSWSPSCGGAPNFTPNPGDTTLNFSNGAVPAQGATPGECWVEVDVSSVTEGNLINTIGINALSANGIDGGTPVVVHNTSPASATITIIEVDPPSMSKGFVPNTIYVGGISQMTIRINNNDPDTNLTNVSFTDNLPSVTTPIAGQVRLANPVSATMTGCGAGASLNSPAPGNTSIVFSGGTITPTVDCVIRVNVTGDGGEYTNSIPAGPAGPGSLRTQQGVTNGSPVEADLNIQPVDITKAFSPAAIVAGDTTVLTITLQNPTDADYTGASLLDTMPAGLTVQASPVPSTTCGAGIVTVPASNQVQLTGGTIPARIPPAATGTCTITATVQAALNASGRFVNTIPPGDFRANGGAVTNVDLVEGNLDVLPALEATKQFAAPYAMARNGLNLVTVTLYNNSSTPLVGAAFSDDLPSGLRVADLLTSPAAPDPATTCGGTVTHDTDTVTLTGGTIPARSGMVAGSCTVTFSVTNSTAGGGTFDNTIAGMGFSACDRLAGPPTPICIGAGGDASTDPDIEVVPADQLPVDVEKVFAPDSTTGNVSALTITLTAPKDIGINGITLTDELPTGMTFASPANATETCPGGTITLQDNLAPARDRIIFTNLASDPLLAADASCQIRVDVTADPGIYVNEILAGTITTAQGRTNELAVARDTLNVTSLTMRKAFYPTMVQDGGKSTLTITLENGSTSALTNVNLVDNFLPPDSQGTATDGIFIVPGTETTTCRIDSGYPVPTLTVAPGNRSISMSNGSIKAMSGGVKGICTITMDVIGENTGSYRNTIPVDNVDATVATTGKLIEPLVSASATLQVRDLEIGIVKGFSPVLVYGGATSTMTIRLINPNATALTGITFTDDMDLFYAPGQSGIVLANPPDFDTGTCGAGSTLTALSPSRFRFQNGVLPPDFSCEMTLKVVMNQNGSRTNRIPAGAVTTFNGVTSDQPTQASITNLPGISVVKVFNPNPVTINEVSTLTLTISNTSNVPVREMDLLDQFPTLPTGLIVKNDIADPTDDPTHTCIDPAAPIPAPPTSLTATGGSQFIQLENGSLAGKGDPSGKDVCTITVKVIATSAGAFENIIPIGGITGKDPVGTPVQNLNPGFDTLRVGNLYSLGNRVWFDTDNDGTIDTNEVGVDGVTVELYNADASGLPTGPVRRTDVTYQGGYYRFDNLEPRTDGYVVVIPASQFAPGGKLAGYWSSGSSINSSGIISDSTLTDPDNDVDSDENGIHQTGGAFIGAVVSKAIVLGPPSGSPEVGNEPTNDDDEPLVSPFGESTDDFSNRTVDFGFYRTSLGNLVYLDKDGNGTYGGSPDIPIPGAKVQLFASNGTTEIITGADGIPGTFDDTWGPDGINNSGGGDDNTGGILSDADGDYLFSGLPAGSYVVKVTPPAAGGYSSTIDNGSAAMQSDNDTPNNNLNNNDNGDGTASGQVSSAPIPLVPGSSGALNQNTITQATGTTHNPTMDFGFLLYSLGNRVWFDTNNNGVIDGAEVGVGGVRVQLFNSGGTEILVGADGVLGTLDDSSGGTFTNSGGYYRFDNLPEGDYVVRISNSNFTSGALRGYWSSGTTMTSAGDLSDSTITDPDNDVDSDENGITTFADGTPSITDVNPINYVSSALITLGPGGSEPTGETDLSGGQGTVNDHANMTADFGFYRTAIGNLVFVNAMIGGVDDGDYDAGVDNPLAGAVVTLYAGNGTTQIPTGPDGILGVGTDNTTGVTTPTTGLYAFSGLPEGDYVVKVTPPAGNYTSLVDTADSTDSGNPDTNTDNNDNGIGTGLGQVSSSTGNPLTTEPGATRVSNVVTNATGTTLDNSVDFGFVSPTYSLGNRVWYDTNNNGLIDAGEEGVGVVRVELYRDSGTTPGTYDPAGSPIPDTFVGFAATDSNGYYRFDNLDAGDYLVVIPTDNFNSGGYDSLVGYWSSGTSRADGADGGTLSDSISPDPDLGPNGAVGGGDDDRDSDDNGATTFSGTGAATTINYVASSAVTLGPGETEPLNENDPTAPFWQGTGDNRANMTLDFGFYKTEIGNLTFVDNNEDGDYDAGVGGDVPLGNATLRIYSAGDATFANPIGAAVTSNATTGVYSFDGLPQGNYVVRVTPPAGYASTIDSNPQNDNDDPDVNVDNNDNGVGLTVGANPSASAALTMNPTTEILSASLTQDNTDGTTTDTSVDFGFTRLRFSLGNRVWFDTDNDGAMDAGEVGVDGVRVRLYNSSGTEILVGPDGRLGTADDAAGGMLTSGGGYYRFDNLYAGDYIVRIPGDNFRNVGAGDNVPGDPLRGYWSSGTNRAVAGTVTDSISPDPDDNLDLNDNGNSTFTGAGVATTVNRVDSRTITLGPDPVEPTNDDDPTPAPQAGESADDQSNRTVDFGFYKTEIGNLVFEDVNIDGDYDSGTDIPMNGVIVRLYAGNDTEIITGADGIRGTADDTWGPNGVVGGGDDNTGGVITGPNVSHPTWGAGEYYFSGLPAGDYIVKVTDLSATYTGMISTIDSNPQNDNDNPDWNVDNNDNGDGEGLVTVTSETTNRLTMTPGGGTRPDTIAKPNVAVTQASGSTTDNTLDFGFVRPYSLGNRVWYDTNNDGVLNISALPPATEGGIQGVRVELYRDNGTTVGVYDPAGSPIPDTFVNFTTTDANGYYRFDNLFPRDYIVVIPADNFRNVGGTDTVPGDPLRGYWSTGTTISGTGVISESATNDPDNDVDGYDNAASDENGRTTFSGSAINYVAAYAVTLGADSLAEPINETNVNGQGAADDHANMTVDFGFYRTAIGNLVYYDNNVNGTYDGGDTAVVGALVHLFASNGTTEIVTGADGIPGTADDGFGPDGVSGGGDDGTGGIRTNGTGNYLFSGLPQGEYIVKVDAPAGTVSTIDSFNQTDNDNPNQNADDNDNGDGLGGGTVSFDAGDFLVMTPGVDAAKPNRTIASGTTTDPTIDFGFVNLVALGNRVWFDTGTGGGTANDGILNGTEAGVPDVTVQLYGLGPDGIANNADDNLVGTTTTSNTAGQEGYYIFDNLYPGKYYVKIPNTEFLGVEQLVGYVSSVGYGAVDDDDDQSGASGDENGIDGLTRTDLTTNGIITPVYTLMPNSEPSLLPSIPPDDVDTNYTGTLADNNVNLTADFGFVRLVAIGNRIWFDDGTGAGGVPDDGIQQPGELGVGNVIVQLFNPGADGVPGGSGANADTQVGADVTTDASGNYVFDNLVPGNYFVHIPASNFDAVAPSPLAGYVSSTGAGVSPLDDQNADENGIDAVALATNGISSRVYTLTPHDAALMPTTDDEATYNGYLDDADVNFTADFGFLQKVAIGNVVWRDNGAGVGVPNDGIQSGTEPGISGVDVELYRNGIDPIGTPYRTTTTDANGRYVFDNLLPGQYFVRIPQTEFAALQPLFNLLSSSDPAVPVTSETADQGVDENGIDNANPAVNGIRSMVYDLQPNTEPTVDDNDTGYTGALDDDNVNYTADFGFTELVGIGNRIWFDTGAGTAYGNGIQDGGEVGVPDGVNVELRRTSDNSLVASTTTSGGTGFYQFNNLLPGNYYVQIPATEFDNVADALFGYVSSLGYGAAGDNDDHLGASGDENGIDAIPTVAGIRTPDYYLEPDMPSIVDDDTGYVGNLDDDNVNFTADFGFYQPFSIGNRVWRDDGAGGTVANINNGLMDASEQPISGVLVELWRESNSTAGLQLTGTPDTFMRFDNTDAGGFYLFDNLAPGDYYVHIPASNFDVTAPNPLYGLYSSTPTGTENGGVAGNPYTPNTDRDDNGVNNARPDLNGISSGMVTLSKDAEPQTEEVSGDTVMALGNSPTAGDGTLSRGRYGETDGNSNLSVDFGFAPPLSLGNRVWLDNGSTPGGLILSQFDDGRMNVGGSEPGIDGVTLSLFYDADNNGSISGAEATTAYATTTTANGGYYLFDKLPAGRYYVEVDASNFNAGNPLSGLLSSSGSFNTENEDVNDNGAVVGAVIRSNDFVLNHGGEPLTPAVETDISGNVATYGVGNVGLIGKTDADSNLTLDFGFISPPHSIGNRLWYDTNNNGVMDLGEPPVSGALVSLYSDEDATVGTPDGTALATDVTDANGYYLFSNLPVGRYLVGVNADNFTDSGAADPYKALVGYTSSVGNQTNTTDLNDNGIDRILPGDATASPYGVLSNNINLTIATPNSETDLSNNAADGAPGYRGTHGELDTDSDLTIDFGFFQPMSIGNRVWRDDGTGGGTINNGIMDGGETPIANVRVELFRDNGNGTFGSEDGAAIRFDNTDAGGYYLFDSLTPGDYFVRIPAAEFQSGGDLFGFNNSTPDGTETAQVPGNELVHTPITDADDNGVYNTRPDTNGITSGLITLALATEPSNESELSGQANPGAPANTVNDPTGWDGPTPGSRGRFGEADNNSNLTVDFGFLPVYSLGNRVWLDDGTGGGTPADGLINGGEAGIGGVTVNLYRDSNNDGTPDGGIIATAITAGGGYYRFDNLIADHYIAEVVTPTGLGSTTDANQDPDNDADNNDDGVIILPTVVRSHPITLGGAAEPTNDNDAAPNPNLADGEAPNNQSNRTVDFGFVGAVALGNVVWYDTGAGAAYNNGIFDAGETGVNGVTVNLYYDANKDNSITGAEATTPYRTTVTAGGGFYQFDQLIPGRYQVGIPASEFLGAEQLVGYTSSTDDIPATTDQTLDNDTDENGQDVTSTVLTVSGIRTIDYVLAMGSMPTADLDREAGGSYVGTLLDNSINFTADFGFTQVVAIGNRVWLDTSAGATYNNGRQDGGEPGAPNVTVELYRSGDPIGTPYRTTTTNASGDYVFDGLRPGDYFVHIPAAEFQPGGDLVGYSSSVGQGSDETTDQTGDENGSDNQPSVNGVSSPLYTLSLNGEPDAALDDETGYPGVLDDNDVNFTADFGFTRLVALGNVVWLDTGAAAGHYNNGIFDAADESGVNGVTVNLYTSTGTFVAATTTANGGTYKFDNLLPGAYYVEIPAGNFAGDPDGAGPLTAGPLHAYLSSTGSGTTVTADNNADENGIDPVSPNTAATSGIRSMVYNLTAGGEPDTDDETSYRADFNSDGRPDGNLDDTSVNFTADFGFVESFSLGNRVWFDADRDGTRNGVETGLPNVPVYLYRDSLGDGIPDGPSIASTLTDGNGYYRFDNLIADTYIVEVTTLVGYASTVDAGDPDLDPGDDDDNGVTLVLVGTENRVRSDPVTLEPRVNSEPQTEGNPPTNPEVGEAPDARSNRTVDFGFLASNATSRKQLTGTIIMDTDPVTGNPVAGTDFTSGTQVAIGEILTYEVRLGVPSGETFTNLVATDTLDPGLAFVGCDSITVSDPLGLTTTLTSFNDACNPDTNPTVLPQSTPESQNDARQVTFSLGSVRNTTADTQTITITYRVIVLDIPANRNGVGGLNNSIAWSWVGTNLPPAAATPVQVVEPELSIDKDALPRIAPYGTNITFTIDISHTAASSTDAFDVVVTDILPPGLQYVAGSASFAGLAPNVPTAPADYYDAATSTLTFKWDTFPLGQTSTITFQATFVGPAPVINSSNVAWTSLPIDPQPSGQPVRLSPYNDFSTERWYDPADLTGLNAYGSSDSVTITLPEEGGKGRKKAWTLPATGFAPDMVTELPPMPDGFAYAQTELMLEIPKLDQSLNIAGVPYDDKKGEWNLTWLSNEAGWLETTAFPTHAGNSALTAHTTLANGQPGPFAQLGTLSYGDQVIVRFGGQKYIFEVRENKQVKPTEVNSALKHEEYPWLTLITCKSYNEQTGEYAYRTVVRAVLVSVIDE